MKGTIKSIKFNGKDPKYGNQYDLYLEGDDTSYMSSTGDWELKVNPGDNITYEVSTRKDGTEIKGEKSGKKWCSIWKVQKDSAGDVPSHSSPRVAALGNFSIPNATNIVEMALKAAVQANTIPGQRYEDTNGAPIPRVPVILADFEVILSKVWEKTKEISNEL
jgi:hypothetical protein